MIELPGRIHKKLFPMPCVILLATIFTYCGCPGSTRCPEGREASCAEGKKRKLDGVVPVAGSWCLVNNRFQSQRRWWCPTFEFMYNIVFYNKSSATLAHLTTELHTLPRVVAGLGRLQQ